MKLEWRKKWTASESSLIVELSSDGQHMADPVSQKNAWAFLYRPRSYKQYVMNTAYSSTQGLSFSEDAILTSFKTWRFSVWYRISIWAGTPKHNVQLADFQNLWALFINVGIDYPFRSYSFFISPSFTLAIITSSLFGVTGYQYASFPFPSKEKQNHPNYVQGGVQRSHVTNIRKPSHSSNYSPAPLL